MYLAVGASWAEPAAAATQIGTTTYSVDTSWTAAGSPYVLNGNVTVAAGATLTVEPGVVVKFNGTTRSLIVNGALSAVGTPSNRIVFTSYQDDSAGGDTNGDGSATTGAAGQWLHIHALRHARDALWRRPRRDLDKPEGCDGGRGRRHRA
jgi:hypothetical protein